MNKITKRDQATGETMGKIVFNGPALIPLSDARIISALDCFWYADWAPKSPNNSIRELFDLCGGGWSDESVPRRGIIPRLGREKHFAAEVDGETIAVFSVYRKLGGGSPRWPETFHYGPYLEWARVLLPMSTWQRILDELEKDRTQMLPDLEKTVARLSQTGAAAPIGD